MNEGWIANFVAQNQPFFVGMLGLVIEDTIREDTIRYYVVDKLRTQKEDPNL